jgi:arylamine N-acetyltransferase
MTTSRGFSAISEPTLAPALLERVLTKLGLRERPTLDLSGLNALYAAVSANLPFDNFQKRIWFAGPQTTALPCGDPSEFFNNWLQHGTGGTCWPLNGAMYALAHALGFDTRRIVGSVIVEGYPRGANHGSVVVTLDRVDYLFDGWMAAFKVLPLIPGTPSSTGHGIHDISVVPIESGFEIISYPGFNREQPLPFRPEPEYDPVDHALFLTRYDRTKSVGFFNDAIFICRHLPDSIITMGRKSKFHLAADGTLTKTEPTEAERKTSLVEEFGLSQEIVEKLPPNVPGGVSPPGL